MITRLWNGRIGFFLVTHDIKMRLVIREPLVNIEAAQSSSGVDETSIEPPDWWPSIIDQGL